MDTVENLPSRPEGNLDDPFDLDIRVYFFIDEGRRDEEAMCSMIPATSTMGGCGGHSSGCS